MLSGEEVLERDETEEEDASPPPAPVAGGGFEPKERMRELGVGEVAAVMKGKSEGLTLPEEWEDLAMMRESQR